MKVVKKTFAEKAYKRTTTEANKTQEQIEKMLESLNIMNVRFTKLGSNYIIEFLAYPNQGEGARKIRINIPIEDENGSKEQIYRVLYHNLKNRFVSVVNGLKEFDEEFLSDLVIIHEGREVRIGEVLAPKYQELLKTSRIPIIHLTN